MEYFPGTDYVLAEVVESNRFRTIYRLYEHEWDALIVHYNPRSHREYVEVFKGYFDKIAPYDEYEREMLRADEEGLPYAAPVWAH